MAIWLDATPPWAVVVHACKARVDGPPTGVLDELDVVRTGLLSQGNAIEQSERLLRLDGRSSRSIPTRRASVGPESSSRSTSRSDAARHKAEGRARVLVEARQVDRCLDGVGARIDHRKGVRILVADEDAVFGLDPVLARLS